MGPDEFADAARILEALVDDAVAGVLDANVREIVFIRGAAAALRASAAVG